MQYPGRGTRAKDKMIRTAAGMADAILRVAGSKLWECTWAMIGHSVGCLVGYELLRQGQAIGLPMPRLAIMSAFIAPDTGANRRKKLAHSFGRR